MRANPSRAASILTSLCLSHVSADQRQKCGSTYPAAQHAQPQRTARYPISCVGVFRPRRLLPAAFIGGGLFIVEGSVRHVPDLLSLARF